jgi:hypothetical protein
MHNDPRRSAQVNVQLLPYAPRFTWRRGFVTGVLAKVSTCGYNIWIKRIDSKRAPATAAPSWVPAVSCLLYCYSDGSAGRCGG